MKINSSYSPIDLQQSDFAGSASKNASVQQSGAPEQADETTFSSKLQKALDLKAQALQAPEVRHDLVASLREKISSGQYKVDSNKVADAIFSEFKSPSK